VDAIRVLGTPPAQPTEPTDLIVTSRQAEAPSLWSDDYGSQATSGDHNLAVDTKMPPGSRAPHISAFARSDRCWVDPRQTQDGCTESGVLSRSGHGTGRIVGCASSPIRQRGDQVVRCGAG
jgi:hypothetical protein